MLQRRLPAFVLSLGFALINTQLDAGPALELKPFAAKYQVTRNNIPLGTLNLRLEFNGQDTYTYTGHTRPGPVIRWFISDEVYESSTGSYANQQIVPHTYEYRQSNDGTINQTLLEFDWDKQKVWTLSGGTRWSQQIDAGTHDKFSQQLALRQKLATGAKSVDYAVADGGRIKSYHYRVVGNEFVNLPYGRLKCLKVRRSKEYQPPDYSIWFAPDLDYLPVKIERQRSSGRESMELIQLSERA